MTSPDTPRLILHIGSPKTGSTAIQWFLHKNRKVLAGSGVNFIRAGRRANAHNLVLQARRNGTLPQVMDEITAEIHSQPQMTHILSAEMYFAARIAPAIADHLPGDIRTNTTVVAYIRRQDKFIEALYKQRVKTNRYHGDATSFLDVKAKTARYSGILGAYAAAFDPVRMVVRPFERPHFPEGDVIRDFCRILGLSDTDPFIYPVATANATLSHEVSHLLALIARSTTINTKDIIRHLSDRSEPDAFGSNDCYTLDQRRAVFERYAEDNELVRRLYCPDLPALFNTDDLAPGAEITAPSAEEKLARTLRAQEIVFDAIAELRAMHAAKTI